MTAILFKIAGAGACCDVSVYQGIISGVKEENIKYSHVKYDFRFKNK